MRFISNTFNTTNKREVEKSIFQSFLDVLAWSDDYKHFFENIRDIHHKDAPDFELLLKKPINYSIGIELTQYLKDAKQINKKGKLIIQSEQVIKAIKDFKKTGFIDSGGFYGIGEELAEIIKDKVKSYEKVYKEKHLNEHWLVIHSDNKHPSMFLGANLEEVFIHNCNKIMDKITHPFRKVFLFSNEKNVEWICEVSRESKLIIKK